jgi:hypothetical protein
VADIEEGEREEIKRNLEGEGEKIKRQSKKEAKGN